MERINSLTQIMQLLQRQFSSKDASKTGTIKKTASSNNVTNDKSAISKTTIKQLESRIVDRIKLINPDDKQWHNKAGRVLVDSVLVWEFGEQIVQDSRFTEMSQKILQTLSSHQKTEIKLHSLLEKFVDNHPSQG